MTSLSNDIRNLARTIRCYPFGKLIAQQSSIANKAMSGKHSGFVGEFNNATRSMERSLRSFRSTFNHDWRRTWSGLDRPVDSNLNDAYRAERRYLDDMESERSKFSSSFLKGWNSWIDSVVSNFRKGFNKLPGYAQSSMKDIISRLNKGINGINSAISSFGGDKKLSTISYARGTGFGHPGGPMLVNDSLNPQWKELVIFPNGKTILPQHCNFFIPDAPEGTQVLSGENTRKVMNSLGVRHYAKGTLSDDEQEKLSEEFEKHPQAAAKELVLKETNWNSKIPLVADFGKAIAIGFARGIANVLKDLMGEVKNPVNGDWSPVIRSAAAKLGKHLSDFDVKRVLNTINHESGGSQTIVNGWDSNVKAGHPSIGLVQFIQSTFDTYSYPGHHNIRSGYNQLLALFNDSTWRSDLRWNGGWSPHGAPRRKANGGLMVADTLYHIAEGNLPEMIIPLDINKRPRALSLIDHTLDKMESDGGGTDGLHSRNSQALANQGSNEYLKQMVGLLGQIAGLSQQQIQAILSINSNDNSMASRRNRTKFYNTFGKDQRLNDFMSY